MSIAFLALGISDPLQQREEGCQPGGVASANTGGNPLRCTKRGLDTQNVDASLGAMYVHRSPIE